MPAAKTILLLLISAVGVQSVSAQGDLEGARRSLAGVERFEVVATVEGPEHLAMSETLRSETLVRTVRGRLLEAGLPVGTLEGLRPNLHIHLNMMQLQNGLIAFSIEADFFQDVLLARNRRQAGAATWNESVVGFVSHDMTSTIAESVLRLAGQFVRDFRTVN
jgi:hypothetical protein